MQQVDVQTRGLAAYTGFVHEGLIQLAETVTLPEGSMAYVLAPVVVEVNFFAAFALAFFEPVST